MKPNSMGMVSGCIVWFLIFSVMSTCLGLVGASVGAVTAQTGFVVETVGGRMCPPDTTPGLLLALIFSAVVAVPVGAWISRRFGKG